MSERLIDKWQFTDTTAHLQICKSRAMANQSEQERKASEQEFWQRMALLDELENMIYYREFWHDNDYELDYDDEYENEWER